MNFLLLVNRYQPTHMRRSSLVRSGAAMTSLRWLFEDAVSLHVLRCSLVALAVLTVSTTARTTLYFGTQNCGENLSGSGTISSPNFPQPYPSNSRCIWRLRASDGQVLRLYFITFDLEDIHDIVLIYNSSDIVPGASMDYTSYWEQKMYLKQFNSQVVIVFMSDDSIERQGFRLDFNSEDPRSNRDETTIAQYKKCGGNFTDSGNISSPNYPEHYPSKISCNWTLQASDGQVLRLFFKKYDVDDSDSLFIYGTTNISKYYAMKYRYNWQQGMNYSFDYNVRVVFMSDESVERHGFLIKFTSEYPSNDKDVSSGAPYEECGGTFTGSGNISSPNYPQYYPSNSICTWILRALDGQVLRLFFNTYDVQNEYDKVLIYNSANISQGAALNYTSYWQQNMYYKQFNSEVIVVFTSDLSIERQGFQIHFASEYPSGSSTLSGVGNVPTTAPYEVCSYNLTDEGNITSPNYPAMYPNNAFCTWTLSASPGKVLLLYCRSFDVEDVYDYLHVTSQVPYDTSTNFYRLTGISSDCSWILGPTAFVTFTSDDSVTRQGFALGYRSIEPPQ